MISNLIKRYSVVLIILLVSHGASAQFIDVRVDNGAFALVPDTALRNKLAATVKGFLLAYHEKNSSNNEYISAGYLKSNVEPFVFLSSYLHSPKPTGVATIAVALAFLPVLDSSFLVKLALYEKLNSASRLSNIYSLVLKPERGKYFVYNTVAHYTRYWEKKQIGSIAYTYQNRLNPDTANMMDAGNRALAKKFNTPTIPITYFKFEDPEQLFKVLGFDYIPNMYYSVSGGLAEDWTNTLYAGNNSEYYLHEAVHFYTSKLFPKRYGAIDEGYATYIGGSGGVAFDRLLPQAQAYLKANPSANLTALLSDPDIRISPGNVPLYYILSATLCRYADKQYGMAGIKQLLDASSGEAFEYHMYKVLKLKHNDLDEFLHDLIVKK